MDNSKKRKSILDRRNKLKKQEPIKLQANEDIQLKINQTKRATMSQTFISQTPNSNKLSIKSTFKKKKNNPSSSYLSKDSSQSTKISEVSKIVTNKKNSSKNLPNEMNKIYNNQPVKILNKKGIFPISPKHSFRDSFSSKDKINLSNSIIEKNNSNNVTVKKEFSLNETLNIISEIQKQFEDNVRNNKKPLDAIKKIINNEYTIFTYVPLSQFQKENIMKDIERTSDLRIKNYEMTFHYIINSIDDIRKLIGNYVSKEKNKSNNDNNNKINENFQMNEIKEEKEFEIEIGNKNIKKEDQKEEDKINIINKKEKKKDNNLITENKIDKTKEKDIKEEKEENIINTNIISKKTRNKVNINIDNIEDTDYKDDIMLENAFIIPPKTSGFNYQIVKEMTRMRSKRFSVFQHESHLTQLLPDTDRSNDQNKLSHHSKHNSFGGGDKIIVKSSVQRYNTEINQNSEQSNEDNCNIF